MDVNGYCRLQKGAGVFVSPACHKDPRPLSAALSLALAGRARNKLLAEAEAKAGAKVPKGVSEAPPELPPEAGGPTGKPGGETASIKFKQSGSVKGVVEGSPRPDGHEVAAGVDAATNEAVLEFCSNCTNPIKLGAIADKLPDGELKQSLKNYAVEIRSKPTPKRINEIGDAVRKLAKENPGLDPGLDDLAAENAEIIPGAKDVSTISADEANAPFVAKKWSPPYAAGTNVTRFTAGEEMSFVRVSGPDNQVGAFLVKSEDIAGLTGEQIQQKLGLPYKPTFISDVKVPAGTRLQVGQIASQPEFGAPAAKGVQYQLLDQIPSSSFTNMRPLR